MALAEGGWTVAIGYRTNEKDAKETLEALEAAGTPGIAVMLDVTDDASVQEAFRRIADEAGNVTGLVNNAGMSRDGLLLKYPMDVYEADDGHEPPRRLRVFAGRACAGCSARSGAGS